MNKFLIIFVLLIVSQIHPLSAQDVDNATPDTVDMADPFADGSQDYAGVGPNGIYIGGTKETQVDTPNVDDAGADDANGVVGGTTPTQVNVGNDDDADILVDNATPDDVTSSTSSSSLKQIVDNAAGDSLSPTKTACTDSTWISVCLKYHNIERAEVGVPALTWSSTLAKQATAWSQHMAQKQSFVHSHTAHTGENIAETTSSSNTLFRLFRVWVNEKNTYIKGCTFPNCQKTSAEVGHYTQMVWRTTTQVGCGWAQGPSYKYLTCQYLPSGNVLGSKVY